MQAGFRWALWIACALGFAMLHHWLGHWLGWVIGGAIVAFFATCFLVDRWIVKALNPLKVALARKASQGGLMQYELECPRCHQREYFGSCDLVSEDNRERAMRCYYCLKYTGKTVEMTLIHMKGPSEEEVEALFNKGSTEWRARHAGGR
jgi:hypothetical protein